METKADEYFEIAVGCAEYFAKQSPGLLAKLYLIIKKLLETEGIIIRKDN